MKNKLFLVIFFLTIFTGISTVKADNFCYYKTDDGKISMAVSIDQNGDGRAVLTKPFNKNDGFRENKEFLAEWNIDDIYSNNTCKEYILFELKAGDNIISAYDSEPSAEKNKYVLKQYDFMTGSSTCVYTGLNYDEEELQIKITVIKNNENLIMYFDDDITTWGNDNITKENEETFNDKITHYVHSDFYSDFITYFEDFQGCPPLGTVKSPQERTTYFSAVDGNYTVSYSLIDHIYPEDFVTNEIVANYDYTFYKEEQQDSIVFSVRAYADGTERLCIIKNATGETCLNVGGDKDVFHVDVDGEFVIFKLKEDEKSSFFRYADSSNPATLLDPGVVYFNLSGPGTYDISKTKVDYSISSDDGEILDGMRFKKILSELYPYLVKAGVGNGKTLYIDGQYLSLYNWGFENTYDCRTQHCEETFQYRLEEKIKNVAYYCNHLYNDYDRLKNNSNLFIRFDECISFDEYYAWLVEEGYVNDLSDNCGILSTDGYQIIKEVLDIIKIAGPLIAIALGIVDFAKAIVSGDADKELKQAGTTFFKRLIAAILLLLLPIILSFLMNLFLKNQSGYDPNDPFCEIIEGNDNDDLYYGGGGNMIVEPK